MESTDLPYNIKDSIMIKWNDGSLVCISFHVRTGWGPFGVRMTYFHCFTYAWLSHWSSIHPSMPMQNSQKHAYFLNSIVNISPMYSLCTKYNSYVPSTVLEYQGMDLFTSRSSTFQKILCTNLVCSLPSWPKWNLHQLTTSANDLSRAPSWLIWYLLCSC